MKEPEDLYEILQVHPSAHQDVIQAAFRRLALLYHPDRNPSPDAAETMKRLNIAYEVLRDPDRRANYDRARAPNQQHHTNANANRGRTQSGTGATRARGAGYRAQRGSVEDLNDWVTQRLFNGVRPDLIVDQLVREGWQREEVHTFVWAQQEKINDAEKARRRSSESGTQAQTGHDRAQNRSRDTHSGGGRYSRPQSEPSSESWRVFKLVVPGMLIMILVLSVVAFVSSAVGGAEGEDGSPSDTVPSTISAPAPRPAERATTPSTTPQVERWRTYHNVEHGYELPLLPGWTVTQVSGNPIVISSPQGVYLLYINAYPPKD